MRVVFVAGWMRSGTTLLAETLGSSPHALSIGEMPGIWAEFHQNRPCSCGQPVRECPVWGRVMAAVGEAHGYGVRDYPLLDDLARDVVTPRRVFELMRLQRKPRAEWPEDVVRYVGLLGSVFSALADVSGAKVLVDSSKSPAALLTTTLVPGIVVDVVQLVRDPRAVANSERRTKIWRGVDARLAPPGRGSLSSAAHWASFNLLARFAGGAGRRYLLVRYEEFTGAPRVTLERVARQIDLDVSGLFVDDSTVRLRESHIAAGNPSRFGDRTRSITEDLSWRGELPASHQAAVLAITAPARAGLVITAPRRPSTQRGAT